MLIFKRENKLFELDFSAGGFEEIALKKVSHHIPLSSLLDAGKDVDWELQLGYCSVALIGIFLQPLNQIVLELHQLHKTTLWASTSAHGLIIRGSSSLWRRVDASGGLYNLSAVPHRTTENHTEDHSYDHDS